MRSLFVVLALLVTTQAKANLHCTALKRELINNSVREIRADLTPISGQGANTVFGVAIEDRFFTVSPVAQATDYLTSITVAPDYTHGVIMTSSFTSDHRFQLSTVDGTTVFKLECNQ